MTDPDPRTAGHGLNRLRAAGIAVTEGVLQAEALAVTLGHVLRVTEGRPAVTLKLALGRDGLVPRGANGAPLWVTGELARAHAHLLRARADAILVGADGQGHSAIKETLAALGRRGVTRLLVEGGPYVARVLLDADLVDEAVIYQGAVAAGSDGLVPFVSEGLDRLAGCGHFTTTERRSFGPDRMTRWQRRRRCSPALSPT